MKRIYGMAILAALFALAAPAQDTVIKQGTFIQKRDAVVQKQIQDDVNAAVNNIRMTLIGMEGGVTANVKNAPFQADQITENTQTLGDGTRIHNEHKVTIYRDSQGRTRREQNGEISIMDPVSGVGYILNARDMTARKTHVSVSVNSGTPEGVLTLRTGVAITVDGGRGGENVPMIFTNARTVTGGTETSSVTSNGQTVTMSPKKETLGTQMMEGVTVEGVRKTSTIDTGDIGNDRPIQIVSERWYSPDLQENVMTRRSDPRTGEEVTRLANIIRAEPDPSLFEVPAGYQIVEPGGRGGRGGRGNDQ